jgi:8-oxo-dGTP diphosphatase
MERFQLLCTVSILFIKDGKIFLIRRANTGYFDGSFEVPAGHIDGGEPIRKAAAREAKEEVGVDVNVEDLEVVHVMHRFGTKNERIEFFLVAKSWKGELKNTELEKCDQIGWFDLKNLPDNMVPKCKHALERYLADETFSEFDWN